MRKDFHFLDGFIKGDRVSESNYGVIYGNYLAEFSINLEENLVEGKIKQVAEKIIQISKKLTSKSN